MAAFVGRRTSIMSTEFVAFARACGLDITHVAALDKIQRVPTFNKPNRKNGALLLRSDGNGWCIAYDGGGELCWFNDPRGPRQWTEAEKAQWLARKRAQEAQDQRRRQAAIADAETMLKKCTLATPGYLVRKGFPDKKGLCMPDGSLFVPMRDLHTNELQGAQLIRWDVEAREWGKKFLPGTRAKGSVFRLGPAGHYPKILCEGLATGYSVEAAVRQMHMQCVIIVCFSAGNIIHVAELLKDDPSDRCVIADNDASQTGEHAAVATGLSWAMPDTVGMDINDVHQKQGVMAACALVMKAVRGARA